ncbi:MAG: hypothetical protein ACR2O0_08890, partial [Rhizobiaceae bacterium]
NITIPDLTAENPVAIGSALVIVAAAKAASATGGVIALANFDRHALAGWETVARIVLAVLLMASTEIVWIGAVAATLVLFFVHHKTRASVRVS